MYEFHELANIFPMIEGVDFNSLKESIERTGQIHPILLYENKILDGRNRYKACIELNIPPIFEEWKGDGSLIDVVNALNCERRNLTPSQKAVIAQKLLAFFEAEAKERQRLAGGDRKSEGYEKSVPAFLQEPIIKPALTESTHLAAAAMKVSPKLVSEAKRISTVAPERLESIANGEKKVSEVINDLKNEGIIVERIFHRIKDKQESKNEIIGSLSHTSMQCARLAKSQLERIKITDEGAIEAFTFIIEFATNLLNKAKS